MVEKYSNISHTATPSDTLVLETGVHELLSTVLDKLGFSIQSSFLCISFVDASLKLILDLCSAVEQLVILQTDQDQDLSEL